MKNTIYILIMLTLLQSCHTYKTFNLKNYNKEGSHKVKIKLRDSQKLKGTISQIKNDSIYLKGIARTYKVSKSDIEVIKKKEISWSKTVILSSAYLMSLLIAFLVYFSKNAFK